MNRRIRAPDRALRRFLPSQRRRRVAKADHEPRPGGLLALSPLSVWHACAGRSTGFAGNCAGCRVLRHERVAGAPAHRRERACPRGVRGGGN